LHVVWVELGGRLHGLSTESAHLFTGVGAGDFQEGCGAEYTKIGGTGLLYLKTGVSILHV
jgi:hypothetical protein